MYVVVGLAMTVTLALAGSVMAYVAFPYRGHHLPAYLRWTAPFARTTGRARARTVDPSPDEPR